jgi:hypothetical protein
VVLPVLSLRFTDTSIFLISSIQFGGRQDHFLQELAAQDFAFDSEPAPLVVSEQDAASAEFLVVG